MINARAETIAEKPSFKNAFKKRRCLIIADGFYEWKGPKGQKQPIFITLADKKPFAFAGLWETWSQKEQDIPYKSCAIITTAACKAIRDIHHRMPIILNPDAYEFWLHPENQDITTLKNILATNFLTDLVGYPVSKQVNSTRNNDASYIDPVE